MRYVMHVIEVKTEAGQYELLARSGEEGPGSALNWADEASAESYLQGLRLLAGEREIDARVVPLAGETPSVSEPDILEKLGFLDKPEPA
jgi:hypothetical protein